MTVWTIPPGVPFLDALAARWLARDGDALAQSEGLFLLPTRRAVRGLHEAFLRQAEGRALLLPRIAALGALDEAPLALEGALALPPPLAEAERLAVLTRMVLAMKGRHGAPDTADRAWLLAAELARLLDEAHREGVDLAQVLPTLVPEDLAQHWQDTLQFLQIVTRHWPEWLAAQGRMDAAERGVRLLEAQAAAWSAAAPGYPVVVAGLTGGVRAAAELMRVVARMPDGHVVLPGVDLDLDEGLWGALEAQHPQAGLRALLADMGVTRGDVRGWEFGPPNLHPDVVPGREGTGRASLLWRALLPAGAMGLWREPFAVEAGGLRRLAPSDEQEEAVAVALALRGALEREGARAALVTPDRALAARVVAELGRYGVVVDDSAGEPLGETPPGAFLRLLARAVAERLAPVALLAVLKHPLAALGLRAAECRAQARRLERIVLRGPAPPDGVAGLRAALAAGRAAGDAKLEGFIDRIEARFGPLLALAGRAEVAPAEALRALIEAAEGVAETDERAGAARLWALEEGEALSHHLVELLAALPWVPPQRLGVLPGLLDASLVGAVVRSRRALRGREGGEHPRVAVLGLLEARLQSFDLVVLGSLAEAVWPPAAVPGPWMSRPMRAQAGLASPEEAVGQMALDFALLCCAATEVVLSCPLRRDGAPAVPARWLVRLEAFLRGRGGELEASPEAGWARMLDAPAGPPVPVRPPEPRPPVARRPRKLSVTEIETWVRDPYAIYARHVLGLRALDPLEQAPEAADFGNLVHAAIKAWLDELPVTGPCPADAAPMLRAAMEAALGAQPIRPALARWWRPRLERIADWVAGQEAARRVARPARARLTEVSGQWAVPSGVPFTLTAKADRIERGAAGLAILDYKTGTLPKAADVEAGLAPQLTLEAAMAAEGAFGPALKGAVSELSYWRLTGAEVPAEPMQLFKGDPAKAQAGAADAALRLVARVDAFDDETTAYLSEPSPGAAPRFTDYRQLARVAEWSSAGADDDQGEAGEETT